MWISILKPEIIEKQSKNAKEQPTENQKILNTEI